MESKDEAFAKEIVDYLYDSGYIYSNLSNDEYEGLVEDIVERLQKYKEKK